MAKQTLENPARDAEPTAAEVRAALERILRSLRDPGLSATTRTTIVLSSVCEKAGVVPMEVD